MIRKAKAVWQGTGRDGQGNVPTDSGVLAQTPYSFKTRFEDEKGTNPEELVAAAHAGCFTMALAFQLQAAGHTPTRLTTEAAVSSRAGGQGVPHQSVGADFARPGAELERGRFCRDSGRRREELPRIQGPQRPDHVGCQIGRGAAQFGCIVPLDGRIQEAKLTNSLTYTQGLKLGAIRVRRDFADQARQQAIAAALLNDYGACEALHAEADLHEAAIIAAARELGGNAYDAASLRAARAELAPIRAPEGAVSRAARRSGREGSAAAATSAAQPRTATSTAVAHLAAARP